MDFALVDAVLEETGAREKRVRLLPARVMVYFVLALALFEHCSYKAVWDELSGQLPAAVLVRLAASSLTRARRRLGAHPLKALFQALAGPVGDRDRLGVHYRGLRTVAIDGTSLHVPEDQQLTWHYPKRCGEKREFGYVLLRLLVIVGCGTRALLTGVFGPEADGETVYAARLLDCLNAAMLLLADAAFDSRPLLEQVRTTGAQFLVRSGARRCPTIVRRLPDGSYLSRLTGPYLPGRGYPALPVRIIEAWITVTLADGTVRREQWRLITSLLDHERYPAAELVDLYHEGWQVEAMYFSVKSTMLDGRVLRSHGVDGIDQEVWALLTAYQALIRAAADAVAHQPRLDMDRLSFPVLLNSAADTVIRATGIAPDGPGDLVGFIGRAALAELWPARRRRRSKARSKKKDTSKYRANYDKHPQQAQGITPARAFGLDVMPGGWGVRRPAGG